MLKDFSAQNYILFLPQMEQELFKQPVQGYGCVLHDTPYSIWYSRAKCLLSHLDIPLIIYIHTNMTIRITFSYPRAFIFHENFPL